MDEREWCMVRIHYRSKQRFWIGVATSLWLGVLLGAASCAPKTSEEPKAWVEFPATFSFGTATSQFQVEGTRTATGDVDSNWSRWLQMGKGAGSHSNDHGNGFYTLYPDEIERASALGLDTFRISVDWARIEPRPGEWDEAELRHLEEVLDEIRRQQMRPVLTLYHWTLPAWVQNPDPNHEGGALDRMTGSERDLLLAEWSEFVEVVVSRVGDRVDMYTVLNEPFSALLGGYIAGIFPPGQVLDIEAATQFGLTLIFMQARAYDVIRAIDDEDADGDGQAANIGMTMIANAFYPAHPEVEQERFAAEQISYVFNDWMMNALTSGNLDVNLDGRVDDVTAEPAEGVYPDLANRIDFIGVQYYGPVVVRDDVFYRELHPLYGNPLLDVRAYQPDLPHNGMHREIRASGFRDTLEIYGKYGLPMWITECGTTTNLAPVGSEGEQTFPYRPEQAAMYLVEHMWEVGKAVEDGIDIRGFFHWTLSDNFEWAEGMDQRFGAYTVDFTSEDRQRTLNPLGEALRDVVTRRGIDEEIWSRYVLPRYPSDLREGGGSTVSTPPPLP